MATTKVTTDNIDLSGNTGALEIPTGTTTQRPGVSNLDFLVVGAGGGVYGYDSPGGGGGGGVRTSYGSQSGGASSPESKFSFDTTGTTSYTLTVGEGVSKLNGEDSVFGSITSLGGGYGGAYDGSSSIRTGGDGASGGGGTGGGSYAAGAGTTGQGFAGGNGVVGAPAYPGGGGGGSGGLGQTAPSGSVLGNGGIGTVVNILPYGTASTINVGEVSGTDVYYGGGGGGNSSVTASGGTGGLGGGADAPNSSSVVDGTINTGGGGAGGIYPVTGVYAKGGSGVVILRYSSDFTLGKTGTLAEASGSPFTDGSEKISVFISGDGTVNFTGGSAAVEGALRENTTTGKMEIYTGSTGWRALQQTGQDVGVTPSNNFNTVLYTGDSSTQAITVGFKPDWVIVKSRTQGYEPTVFDTVRGALERIRTSSDTSEDTKTGSLTSFDTNGFTTGNYAGMNNSGQSFVAWCWKAGGNSNTFNKDGTGYATATAAGLTTGTITPTGSSVGTETGFSIIKYTANGVVGATIPHGLGAAPDLYIIKALDSARNWIVGTWMIPNTTILQLDLADAVATYDAWDSTYPDANNITVSNANPVNASGDYIMYCFRSIPGYSQIGFYNGTDVTSGNKIYTGFKPAWLMVRNISTSKYWYIVDNKRSTTNPRNKELYFNVDVTEVTMDSVSFFDYGFELVTTDSGYNDIGDKYLFMAFSE